jgi:hypothetical protein
MARSTDRGTATVAPRSDSLASFEMSTAAPSGTVGAGGQISLQNVRTWAELLASRLTLSGAALIVVIGASLGLLSSFLAGPEGRAAGTPTTSWSAAGNAAATAPPPAPTSSWDTVPAVRADTVPAARAATASAWTPVADHASPADGPLLFAFVDRTAPSDSAQPSSRQRRWFRGGDRK